MAKKKEQIEEPLEKQLWKAADKLRKNIDAGIQGRKHILRACQCPLELFG